jgi:hypothetical protein
MKKVSLLILMSFSVTISLCQLKVDNGGRVGIGTMWPNPGFRAHIKGNMLITNYPDWPFYQFRIDVTSAAHPRISSSTGQVHFNSAGVWNSVYGMHIYQASDRRLKSNEGEIKNALEKILKLRPYIYDILYKVEKNNNEFTTFSEKKYGFFSDEIEKTLNDVKITDDVDNTKMMDYIQIIPLLVAGIQEQQKKIDQLETSIAIMMTKYNPSISNEDMSDLIDMSKLLNNIPNPFTNSTVIPYVLGSNLISAEIKIWDYTGKQIKGYSLDLTQNRGFVNLNSVDLPSSGVYVYALIVNGQIIDAKNLSFQK